MTGAARVHAWHGPDDRCDGCYQAGYDQGVHDEPIDLPTLAEAIRLWYVETGRNPVTGNWDQPQAGWLIAKYDALCAALDRLAATGEDGS